MRIATRADSRDHCRAGVGPRVRDPPRRHLQLDFAGAGPGQTGQSGPVPAISPARGRTAAARGDQRSRGPGADDQGARSREAAAPARSRVGLPPDRGGQRPGREHGAPFTIAAFHQALEQLAQLDDSEQLTDLVRPLCSATRGSGKPSWKRRAWRTDCATWFIFCSPKRKRRTQLMSDPTASTSGASDPVLGATTRGPLCGSGDATGEHGPDLLGQGTAPRRRLAGRGPANRQPVH